MIVFGPLSVSSNALSTKASQRKSHTAWILDNRSTFHPNAKEYMKSDMPLVMQTVSYEVLTLGPLCCLSFVLGNNEYVSC